MADAAGRHVHCPAKFFAASNLIPSWIRFPARNFPFPSTFNFTTNFPFPTATNTLPSVSLPFVAFNYLGQLTADGQTVAGADEYIPIAKGSVIYAAYPGTKVLSIQFARRGGNPPGNSTNSSYNIVHIDRLTGRAVLEYQKLQ